MRPKNLNLFGRYLKGKMAQRKFSIFQITKMLPQKYVGRPPSAASQMALFGDEDHNVLAKINSKHWGWKTKWGYPLRHIFKRTEPSLFKKDFESQNLNTTIYNLRVTPNALYQMDEKGSFDDYIMRTPPEDLRSNAGEKMRDLMWWYMENPECKAWGLPWKVLMRKRDRADPHFARYLHESLAAHSERKLTKQHGNFSPYYLPQEAMMHPERQPFADGAPDPVPLNIWWKESPELERAFRLRLKDAKSFEQLHATHRDADSYRFGEGRGGGGPPCRKVRKRMKTRRYRTSRPY
mmetsp:Transcript_32811/g.73494  ORF Transcript_32811/g.73494 Transcript_32811/m.73494 type:complete len:293 (+) Transcript_32811:41-919(+)